MGNILGNQANGKGEDILHDVIKVSNPKGDPLGGPDSIR